MEDVTLLIGISGMAVVVALVQLFKAVTALSDDPWNRIAPLVAVVAGLGWNALVGSMVVPALTWQVVVLQGILSGLAASGLYSGQKALRGQ